MGMLAMVEVEASDERTTNVRSSDGEADDELVEAETVVEAELVRTEECEEVACSRGWKFGKRSLTSCINDETCRIS